MQCKLFCWFAVLFWGVTAPGFGYATVLARANHEPTYNHSAAVALFSVAFACPARPLASLMNQPIPLDHDGNRVADAAEDRNRDGEPTKMTAMGMALLIIWIRMMTMTMCRPSRKIQTPIVIFDRARFNSTLVDAVPVPPEGQHLSSGACITFGTVEYLFVANRGNG